MDLTVFVPTRGRSSMTQITLNELRQFAPDVKPVLVCPEGEENRYRNAVPNSFAGEICGCPATNINETHQWMLKHCPTPGFVSMDDDMYFSRRNMGPGDLVRVTSLRGMFDWISDQLDVGFVHGGISARQGNQHITPPFTDCIRVNNVHFFNADRFRRLGITLPAEPVMHDFFFTLSLLTRGYPNRVNYDYCWSQRGSGTKGGCSSYRTQELQRVWCNTLHNEFPDFVKIVVKNSLSGGSVFEGTRVDVNIQWLKAWAHGKLQATPDYIKPDVFTERH